MSVLRSFEDVKREQVPPDPRACNFYFPDKGEFCGAPVDRGNRCTSHLGAHNPYRKVARTKLRELLDAIDTETGDDRTDLSSEIDLARCAAVEAADLWQRAHFDLEASDDLKALASSALRDAIDGVARIASQHAKIRATNAAVLDARQTRQLVDGITRVLTDVLVKDMQRPDLFDEILRRIENVGIEDRGVVRISVN